MSNQGVDHGRRRFLTLTTTVVGGAGTVAAVWPFLASLKPSERAKALGAPVTVDVGKIEPGQRVIVAWRGKPVWFVRRTPEMLASLRAVDAVSIFPELTPDELIRAVRPHIHTKGGDYRPEDLPEAKAVREVGAVICVLGLVEDRSTTRLVEIIRRGAKEDG